MGRPSRLSREPWAGAGSGFPSADVRHMFGIADRTSTSTARRTPHGPANIDRVDGRHLEPDDGVHPGVGGTLRRAAVMADEGAKEEAFDLVRKADRDVRALRRVTEILEEKGLEEVLRAYRGSAAALEA